MLRGKVFYGWVIVAALCVICAVPMVFTYSYWSFYQVPICADIGCTYVEFNLSNVASTIAGMVFGVFFANKFSSGNTKRYMIALGIINGLTWIGMGLCHSIWPIVALYFVVGFCGTGMFTMGVNIIIPNWFIDRRGMAISICFAGSGLGGVLFSPVMSSNIEVLGWRTAIMVAGAICLILYPLIVGIFVRKSPAEMGLEPYRMQTAASEEVRVEAPADTWEGVSKGRAVKSVAFVGLAGAMACCGIIAAGVLSQLPTYLTELGIDYAPVISANAAGGIIALLIMGPIFDKLGVVKGMLLESIILACTFAAFLMISRNVAFAYVGAVMFAFGAAVSSLGPPLLTIAAFGSKDYAGIYGLANTLFMAGCMLGPIGCAGIRTATGSYDVAWMAFIVVSILLFLFTFLAIRSSKKFRTECTE